MPPPQKLVAIVGPTASGKSSLAIALASRFNGEIINADSRQIYRRMEIGTATPSEDDQSIVPHHLYGIVDPDARFSLAVYLRLAHAAVDNVLARGRVPFLVGGTGQYVWALLEGWQIPEVPPRPDLREELQRRAEREGSDLLYAELLARDPAAAERIHPNNLRRVIRALEVLEQLGPSEGRRRKSSPPYDSLILAISWERAALYQRIDDRLLTMLEDGFISEVQSLLDRGYAPELASMTSLGYREIAAYLRGQTSLEDAIELTKWSMHRLARMQSTWFRSDDERIHWVDGGADAEGEADKLVRAFLVESADHNN